MHKYWREESYFGFLAVIKSCEASNTLLLSNFHLGIDFNYITKVTRGDISCSYF